MLVGLLAAPLIANAAVDFLLLPRVEQAFARGDSVSAFALLEDAIKNLETAPDAQVDLLATLASARLARGDFADAGEAYALRAELTGRLKGASAPELAGLNAAGADAYIHAGRPESALPLAKEAIRVDGIYTDCASPILARDHARLADILAALGRAADAADERRLAGNLAIRCGRTGRSSRGVVVTNDFANATPDSFAQVKVFYVTDRAPSGSDRPNDFYGPERGKIDYGVLEVTVPRIHKPGSVEAPSLIKFEWSENPERHFVITKLATMNEAEMFVDMGSTLDARRSDEVFVFVHGFNVTFADAAKRTAQIAYDINFEGAPILYSWASRGSTLAYTSDEAVVRLSGRYLLRFLEDLVAQSRAKHINLIAHSMGNRALADALELLAAKRSGAGESAALFDQVIFAAPDEDAGLFAEMIKTVRPLARRLTLYGSENDLALYASRQVHGDQPRAGEGGAAILLSDQLDSIDMSVLGDDMLGHGYFATATSALTDIQWLFWRDTPPDWRCGMDAKVEPAGRFWLFDPVRCDGPVMLSALTLLKANQGTTLAKLDAILAKIGSDPDKARETAEWQAIRKVVTADMMAK